MRLKLYFFLLLLSASYFSHAQLNSGLIAHWPFDSNLNDATSNGHTAILSTGSAAYAPGFSKQSSTAFDFENGKLMETAYKADLNLTKFTICAVINIDSLPQPGYSMQVILRRITDAFEPPTCAYGAAITNVFTSTTGQYKPDYCLYGYGSTDFPADSNTVQYSPPTDTNRWYYIAVTYDSFAYTVYVNGVIKKVFVGQGTAITPNNYGLLIGSNKSINISYIGDFFYGLMDDLRLYNRALSMTEVLEYPLTLKDTAVALNAPIIESSFTGSPITINYLTSPTFRTGNVFTVQLSDSAGSFDTPVDIGTDTATSTGSMTCNIPLGLSAGYRRMRIVASLPADTSFEHDIFLRTLPTVQITPYPSYAVYAGQDITFSAVITDSFDNGSLQWLRNGQDISGATSDSVVVNDINANDRDTISLIYKNVSSQHTVESNKVVIIFGDHVNDIDAADRFNIFPNPNDGSFEINATVTTNKVVPVEIIDINGAVVYRDEIKPANSKLSKKISLRNIANGTYILKAEIGGEIVSMRLSVNR